MVYVAGIDIGSAFSKALILASAKVVSYHILPSGGNYKDTVDKVVNKALKKAGLSLQDINFTVSTGYGASNVSHSDEAVSDISCQGKGASHLFSSARTVVDIGGQFSRVSRIDEGGRVTGFLLSEKCAAGSGRFLQVIARVLQIDLKEIGELSLKSKKRIDFNTGCAVFAETEVVSRVAEGARKEDILAGMHRALAAKIQVLVERVGLKRDCALIGGGAKDIGLVKSIEEKLGFNLLVPEEPQIIAALGAALIAEEKYASVGKTESKWERDQSILPFKGN